MGYFLPFYPPNSQKNENFKRNEKKTPGDIIIFHKCTKTHDHMLYCSWDMSRDGCNCCFSFWAIFCPFTPETAQKIKIPKKWKKRPEISSFYTIVLKIMIIGYTVPEIWPVTDNCYYSFWAIFCPFTPLAAQKIKISKQWKPDLEISSFYTSVPKIMITGYTVPEIRYVTHVIFILGSFLPFYTINSPKNQKNEKNSWRYHHFTHVYQKLWLGDARLLTDGRTEKVTQRGGCPT